MIEPNIHFPCEIEFVFKIARSHSRETLFRWNPDLGEEENCVDPICRQAANGYKNVQLQKKVKSAVHNFSGTPPYPPCMNSSSPLAGNLSCANDFNRLDYHRLGENRIGITSAWEQELSRSLRTLRHGCTNFLSGRNICQSSYAALALVAYKTEDL